ncbi:11419_t:CDS:2 [Entrophospora sp. SA101]|nr:11419_t:CDS:2 [Entrophospora sp. SA101]
MGMRAIHSALYASCSNDDAFINLSSSDDATKKIRKFQTKCIQIAKEILNEEPIIEYRPSFLNGLELDAFFQKYQIVLEVQGSQHRLHNTSWYKDVKKLEDIVNRDRKKRCLCQLNGIYLIETWYDENPEVTIPEKIYKYREEIFNLS